MSRSARRCGRANPDARIGVAESGVVDQDAHQHCEHIRHGGQSDGKDLAIVHLQSLSYAMPVARPRPLGLLLRHQPKVKLGAFQPPGYFNLASSSDTAGTMIPVEVAAFAHRINLHQFDLLIWTSFLRRRRLLMRSRNETSVMPRRMRVFSRRQWSRQDSHPARRAPQWSGPCTLLRSQS